MTPVTVVTDTTNYLPRELADKEGIHQVSLYVGWQDDQQREIELDAFDAFYERLRTDPDLPTTSQPSIGDFLAVWEPLLEDGKDIVSIHLAGGISGTCESARQAHGLLVERGLGERVEVIDGETACGGLGLVLLAAAAAARGGADKQAVAARAREARKALKIWFCVDTLEYLRRGGRVGKAQAWIGGTLKIKPILSLEYEITPVERVRTAKRAFERMVQYAQELHDSGADRWVVQHIQANEQADRLIDRCREIFGSEPLFTSEVGPVIGTYTGPGLLGVGASPTRSSPDCRSGAASFAPAAASKQQHAHDSRADRDLALVALDVAAPIGDARHFGVQIVERHSQLGAVGLDRVADLSCRALCHRLSPFQDHCRLSSRFLSGGRRRRAVPTGGAWMRRGGGSRGHGTRARDSRRSSGRRGRRAGVTSQRKS